MADNIVNVRVLFFAKSREITGSSEGSLQVKSRLTTDELLRAIVATFPQLSVIQDTVVLAVNQEYIDKGDNPFDLRPDDEVAVIPPISGVTPDRVKMPGQDFVRVTSDPLCIQEATSVVTSPTSGAISVFIGTTRNNFEGKEVVRLEYEAYAPMALKEMQGICGLIRDRWQVEHMAVFHRIGVVPVSEASVIIAVSSPHRRASLESVQYAIDTLKAKVPIWKKEMFADEAGQWKENKECPWSQNSTHNPGEEQGPV